MKDLTTLCDLIMKDLTTLCDLIMKDLTTLCDLIMKDLTTLCDLIMKDLTTLCDLIMKDLTTRKDTQINYKEIEELINIEFPEIIEFGTADYAFIFDPNNPKETIGFNTLCSVGIKLEAKTTLHFDNSEEALERYKDSLCQYLSERINKKKKYKLVWRAYPTLREFTENNEYKCYVWSRLLVHEKE
jgi:hypothetical protein